MLNVLNDKLKDSGIVVSPHKIVWMLHAQGCHKFCVNAT